MTAADAIDFEFPRSFDTVAEAVAGAIGARFELRRFSWDRCNEITFAPPFSYFEMTDFRSEGRYLLPSFDRLVPQGEIRFYPAAREFQTRWRGREQKSLFCRIDIPRITGVPMELSREQLPATIDVRNAHIRSLLLRARRELAEPGFCSRMILDSISLGLAAEILQHLAIDAPARRGRGDRFGQGYLHALAARIREDRVRPDIAQLAGEQGMSVRHFERLFRAAAGESPAAFCRRHLLAAARDLLADRSMLVKEIAFRCGFATTASFSAAFRQMEGVSPLQFRDRLRGG